LYSGSPVTDREGCNRFIYLDLGKSTGHSFEKRKEKKKKRKKCQKGLLLQQTKK
jgi:hypothetical protein